MTRQEAFNHLRTMLATLYPEGPTARRVVQDAGLELHRIDFSGIASNTWNSILREAENASKMEDVFRVVLNEYGTNPDLRTVCDNYRLSFPESIDKRRLLERDEYKRSPPFNSRRHSGLRLVWFIWALVVLILLYFLLQFVF